MESKSTNDFTNNVSFEKLHDWCLTIIDFLQLEFPNKEMTYMTQLFKDAAQIVEVLGDHSLIYSIFHNLIDNTIAYATGASRLDINCTEVEGDGEHQSTEGRHFYQFTVSDNGPGVESVHLDHIFERFYRIATASTRAAHANLAAQVSALPLLKMQLLPTAEPQLHF